MNLALFLPARRASAIVGMMLLAVAPNLVAAQGLPPSEPTPAGIWSIGGNVGGIVLSRFKSGLVNEMNAQGWGEDQGPNVYSEGSDFPSFSSDALPSVRVWTALSLPRNFEVRVGWGSCDLGSVVGNRNGIGEVFVSGKFETTSAILFYGVYEPWIRVGAGPTLDRRLIGSDPKWSTSAGFSFLVHATLHQASWYFVAAEAEQHFSKNARIAQTIPGLDGNPHTFEISALPVDATWVGVSLGLRFGHGAHR